MGWFQRVVRWLTGGLAPERGFDARSASSGGAAPAPEADPYFAAVPVPVIKKPQTLGLDAGAFLPISRGEIKKAAKGQNLFANPWFGRRDRIPPADDLRTKIIDRAMVTQGLITAEDLVEIHTAGEEMEQARPSMEGIAHEAALAGAAAVEGDREARARLKAGKEAARRREEARCGEARLAWKRTSFSWGGVFRAVE